MDYAFALVENIVEVRYEEDFVDRLNYQFTPFVLVACAALIFAKLLVGAKIHCFTKAQFLGTWNAYTHDYCLIENTYYVPVNSTIPGVEQRSEGQIAYYQWTGFILVGFALFLMLPHVIWRSFNWISGYHIRPLIKECYEGLGDEAKRAKAVAKTANTLLGASELDHQYFHVFRRNTFVTFLYFLMKILFLAVIALELHVLKVFLGSYTYPFQVFQHELGDWQSSGLFPRVTLCDIDIRVPGQFQKYTMECTLPLNMLNEKIFVFLYFNFLLLGLLTVFNILQWIVLIVLGNRRFFAALSRCQERSIADKDRFGEEKETLLEHTDVYTLVNRFVDRIRGSDLTVVLHLLKNHVGLFLASDVLLKMVEIDRERELERKKITKLDEQL